MTDGDLLGAQDAANELGIAKSTLTRWVQRGKARAIRISPKALAFERAEIDRLKAENGAAVL